MALFFQSFTMAHSSLANTTVTGDARRKGISSHNIDLVLQYYGFSTRMVDIPQVVRKTTLLIKISWIYIYSFREVVFCIYATNRRNCYGTTIDKWPFKSPDNSTLFQKSSALRAIKSNESTWPIYHRCRFSAVFHYSWCQFSNFPGLRGQK